MLYIGTIIHIQMVQPSLDSFSLEGSTVARIFRVGNGCIKHPLLRPDTVSHRVFQHTIAERSFWRNALVGPPMEKTRCADKDVIQTHPERDKDDTATREPTPPSAIRSRRCS